MQEKEILNMIQKKFAHAALEWVEAENGDNYLYVPGDKIVDIVRYLKESWELSFDFLINLSAMDGQEHIVVTYHLYSYRHRHFFILKVRVPRENGEIQSLTPLYGAANFQEREVFDHFGVKFKGHPDLRRILLPEDWVGYPLLKDYKEPEEYNGMGTTRPSLL